jgi:hypothetical protein
MEKSAVVAFGFAHWIRTSAIKVAMGYVWSIFSDPESKINPAESFQ